MVWWLKIITGTIQLPRIHGKNIWSILCNRKIFAGMFLGLGIELKLCLQYVFELRRHNNLL